MNDSHVYRYLSGALEPGAREELEARLVKDPELRRYVAELARGLLTEPPPADRWRVPAIGLPSGRTRFTVATAAAPVMGGPSLVDVAIGDHASPEDVDVVLLRRVGERWVVVFPSAPEDCVKLAAIPPDADGRRRLQIAPAAEDREWAVALVPAGLEADWTVEEPARWARTREGVADGRVALAAVRLPERKEGS